MFANFLYESIPLKDIKLDERNPRIVTQKKLTSQDEIVSYLYEHEDLEEFIKKIASEGKNRGAERPYVIRQANEYKVIEGNTRIAAYKILTGLLTPPKEYAISVPHLSEQAKTSLLTVDCTIAPDRDSLLPIMASAHFGLGDKTKWGYLGSRKAVYDEWKAGKSIAKLAKAFDRSQSDIKELIVEYLLYLKALGLNWTKKEKEALLNPAVEFNPPVRFLQTKGHKDKIGISLDTSNLKVILHSGEAKKRFKHLIRKLVISPQKGLGATATYDDVFVDYGGATSGGSSSAKTSTKSAGATSPAGKGASSKSPLKSGALFAYPVTLSNALIIQLMREARDVNIKKFPAASTFLLRNIVEAILKEIIHKQKANTKGKTLDLEGCLHLCLSNAITLPTNDKKILKEFLKDHINYLNLGSHAGIIPNADRCAAARDSIDQFVKSHA